MHGLLLLMHLLEVRSATRMGNLTNSGLNKSGSPWVESPGPSESLSAARDWPFLSQTQAVILTCVSALSRDGCCSSTLHAPVERKGEKKERESRTLFLGKQKLFQEIHCGSLLVSHQS